MKTVKVKFVDVGSNIDYQDNIFLKILKERYNVVISDEPDFVFYSVFGNSHLKYSGIRIFFTGECVVPDFNECDYALGFDYLTFEDRYLRFPLYLFDGYRDKYEATKEIHKSADDIFNENREFCSFVVSNADCIERYEMFAALSRYKFVASGGGYCNNIGGRVGDKQEFIKGYKFNIAGENSRYPGYTTEKIVEAFAAGSIPIYFGDPKIAEVFNPDSFVDYNDFNSVDELAEKIKEIDNNSDLYYKMLKTPRLLINENNDKLREFLYNIFDSELVDAYRRPINTRSRITEEQKNLDRTVPDSVKKMCKKLYDIKHKIK